MGLEGPLEELGLTIGASHEEGRLGERLEIGPGERPGLVRLIELLVRLRPGMPTHRPAAGLERADGLGS
jgi:hypothetical protein